MHLQYQYSIIISLEEIGVESMSTVCNGSRAYRRNSPSRPGL